ncbi:MAG: phosphoribosyltransferase family protein, partial [Candidatus Nanohaloarchaea archaeon]|nr:phosphoribosyltransferase family protein [Candidatus Nanohaloarchaea archaeon]
ENSYTVSIEGESDVEGKNVLVFDDIIETGGTMVEMFETLQEQGAERIEAAAVHGVLDDGVERVASTYDDLHLTNSIANEAATTGIEPLVKEIHSSSR